MEVITELFTKKNLGQVILLGVFILYLVVGYRLPYELSVFLASTAGTILILVFTFFILMTCNTIVGMVAIIVAYELMKTVRKTYLAKSGRSAAAVSGSSDYLKDFAGGNVIGDTVSYFNKTVKTNTSLPKSLEEEVIDDYVGLYDNSVRVQPATYFPQLENAHDSAPV